VINKVDATRFRHFRGKFGNRFYDSAAPPTIRLPNHPSTAGFEDFIDKQVAAAVRVGASVDVGAVNDPATKAPICSLPLSIEETKPRLIWDGRFRNLWDYDQPFQCEGLTDIPGISGPGAFLWGFDHISGYYHVCLTAESVPYFGYEWRGRFYAWLVLPFGWKLAPYVYDSFSSQVSRAARRLFGLRSLHYLDDALGSSRPTAPAPWAAANGNVYVFGQLCASLGFFLHLDVKSILSPTQRMPWLGLIILGEGHFVVPVRRAASIRSLAIELLTVEAPSYSSMERFAGKVASLLLAFPPATCFLRHVYAALSRSSRFRPVLLDDATRDQITWWSTLPDGASAPWLQAAHVSIVVDVVPDGTIRSVRCWAPDFYWADRLPPAPGGPATIHDKLAENLIALLRFIYIDAPASVMSSRRIDIIVPRAGAYKAAFSSAATLSTAFDRLPTLFEAMVTRAPALQFVPPRDIRGYGNPDAWLDPTDWTLADLYFLALEVLMGMFYCEAFASPLNARLRIFYTRMPHPASAGVNALSQRPRRRTYANAPFILLGPWIQHCRALGIHCIIIVPQWDSGKDAATWWPVLALSQAPRLLLAPAGTAGVFTRPTGLNASAVPQPPTPWAIWAFDLVPGTY
jgi:hypothetical protein